MIRSLIVATAVAAGLPTLALAQNAYVAGANAPPVPIVVAPARVDSNFLLAKDVPVIPMAEWLVEQKAVGEQTGARVLIAAGPAEIGRAPPEASRYDSQTFRFPAGEVRVLSFRKDRGGVVHQITTEKSIYVVKGSAIVDVAGVATEIGAGDVVHLPGGVLRSRPGKPEDTTVVAYTVRDGAPAPKAAVIRGKDVKPFAIASGAKAGLGKTKTSVKRYVFDGNSIRAARLTGKGSTEPVVPKVDVLIYMLDGPMQLTVGDEVQTVSAGDVLCEAAGKSTHWEVPARGAFIATNAPPPAAGTTP